MQAEDRARVKSAILDFLKEQKVMTVSVADKGGVPWAVPVFYVSDGLQLYWLSRSAGRIGSYLAENPRAVVTIIDSENRGTAMRGLQAEGSVSPVDGRWEWLKIARRYSSTFPDVIGKIAISSGMGTLGKLKDLSIYRFQPRRCWFTDHSRGFGDRVELDLP